MVIQWLKCGAIFCAFIAFLPGCIKETQEPAKASPKKVEQVQGFVGIVIGSKLPQNNKKTIGAAFDEYKHFAAREWKESRNADGKSYVDFRGYFPQVKSGRDGVVREGLEVKFVVNMQGDLYVGMVSRIEVTSDGRMTLYPLGDGNRIMDLIYANEEIKY